MSDRWIADRMRLFDSSGIRKVFDLAKSLKDPINLSIGQPDFDVPEPVRAAAVSAIGQRRNAYSVTQGIAELKSRLAEKAAADYGPGRELFITSGTSGALMLAILSTINPGDEVIALDPFFVMYPSLTSVAGGRMVLVDANERLGVDVDRVAAAITPRTKVLIVNSPANPTGIVLPEADVKALAELAAKHGLLLISDELYRQFCYEPFTSPAKFNPDTLVIDGFSKSHAMTGWRVGWAHGPPHLIREMLKLQQYSFVCAPQPFQWAAAAALDVDMTPYVESYRRKRDKIVVGLAGHYELVTPGGAFYAWPKLPPGLSGDEFVKRGIEKNLLVIPGHIFSRRDTHFRISYAADDVVLDRGVDVLRSLAS